MGEEEENGSDQDAHGGCFRIRLVENVCPGDSVRASKQLDVSFPFSLDLEVSKLTKYLLSTCSYIAARNLSVPVFQITFQLKVREFPVSPLDFESEC